MSARDLLAVLVWGGALGVLLIALDPRGLVR